MNPANYLGHRNRCMNEQVSHALLNDILDELKPDVSIG